MQSDNSIQADNGWSYRLSQIVVSVYFLPFYIALLVLMFTGSDRLWAWLTRPFAWATGSITNQVLGFLTLAALTMLLAGLGFRAGRPVRRRRLILAGLALVALAIPWLNWLSTSPRGIAGYRFRLVPGIVEPERGAQPAGPEVACEQVGEQPSALTALCQGTENAWGFSPDQPDAVDLTWPELVDGLQEGNAGRPAGGQVPLPAPSGG